MKNRILVFVLSLFFAGSIMTASEVSLASGTESGGGTSADDAQKDEARSERREEMRKKMREKRKRKSSDTNSSETLTPQQQDGYSEPSEKDE